MENRLSRFIGSTAVRRFMGLTDHNVDLLDIMDSGKILLVNLGASGFLDRKAATVFASLLVYEFMDTAMRRAVRGRGSGNKPSLYPLYLDEFQNYITDDIGDALDQALKGGLHLVLAHQHLGHLADNPELKKSVFTNARIRAVFGGLDYEDACILGNEMFLPDLNTRQIKKAYYHTIHIYDEQTRIVRSHSHTDSTAESHGTSAGSGFSSGSSHASGHASGVSISGAGPHVPPEVEGWSTETRSSGDSRADVYVDSRSDFSGTSDAITTSEANTYGETVVPVWVPIPKQELATEMEWTREEKLSHVAQLLKEQMQQHCFIKIDRERTEPLLVPFVRDVPMSEKTLSEFQQEVYERQGALPAAEVDEILKEGQQKFLSEAGVRINLVTSDAEESLGPRRETTSAEQSKSIWPRTPSMPIPASTTPDTTESTTARRGRKPGPKPDVSSHVKVAAIVAAYGESWDSEESLPEVCRELDDAHVPPSAEWAMLRPAALSWRVACREYRDRVVKAIVYRRDHAPRDPK